MSRTWSAPRSRCAIPTPPPPAAAAIPLPPEPIRLATWTGNSVDSDKYPYKLAWMRRLRQHAKALLAQEEVVVLGGDYNVCPTDDDVYDPVGWRNDALCRTESRAEFRALMNLGYTDAVRALNPQPHYYRFWDYHA